MTAGRKIHAGFGRRRTHLVAAMADLGGLISYVDSRQHLRYVSKALADWLGCTPEEAVGRTLSELYGPQTFSQFEI